MPSAATDLCALRDAMARIERVTADARGTCLHGRSAARVPLGQPPLDLDRILGGGLRRGALHEILAAGARDEAAAAAFAVALAVRCAGAGALIWIVEDSAARETGVPYRPGLSAQGLDPDKLVLVKTRDTPTTLWATEEALRAGVGVVITELWRARGYDLAASRRLLMAARRNGGMNLLVHVGRGAGDELSSAAETRFAVAAAPGESRPSAAGRMPLPGLAGFAVRLLKLRGSAAEGLRGFDRDAVHALVWDRDGRGFRLQNPTPPARRALPAGRSAGFSLGGWGAA